MEQEITIYVAKATESLLTAESKFANGRYNSCAKRCYYACFLAAIAALLREGIRPAGQWSHAFVQAQLVGGHFGRQGTRWALDDDLAHRCVNPPMRPSSFLPAPPCDGRPPLGGDPTCHH